MDLLHKRYASPFPLLDRYICYGGFGDYIELIVLQRNEERLWDLYLHSLPDKSFDDWKAGLNAKKGKQNIEVKKGSMKETVKSSEDILLYFCPEEGVNGTF